MTYDTYHTIQLRRIHTNTYSIEGICRITNRKILPKGSVDIGMGNVQFDEKVCRRAGENVFEYETPLQLYIPSPVQCCNSSQHMHSYQKHIDALSNLGSHFSQVFDTNSWNTKYFNRAVSQIDNVLRWHCAWRFYIQNCIHISNGSVS